MCCRTEDMSWVLVLSFILSWMAGSKNSFTHLVSPPWKECLESDRSAEFPSSIHYLSKSFLSTKIDWRAQVHGWTGWDSEPWPESVQGPKDSTYMSLSFIISNGTWYTEWIHNELSTSLDHPRGWTTDYYLPFHLISSIFLENFSSMIGRALKVSLDYGRLANALSKIVKKQGILSKAKWPPMR